MFIVSDKDDTIVRIQVRVDDLEFMVPAVLDDEATALELAWRYQQETGNGAKVERADAVMFAASDEEEKS